MEFLNRGSQTKISGDGWRKQQNRQLFLNVGGGEFERWVFSSDSPKLSSSPFCSAQECQGRGGNSVPTLTYTCRRVGGLCVTAHEWCGGGGGGGEFTLLGNCTSLAEGGVSLISHLALLSLSLHSSVRILPV